MVFQSTIGTVCPRNACPQSPRNWILPSVRYKWQSILPRIRIEGCTVGLSNDPLKVQVGGGAVVLKQWPQSQPGHQKRSLPSADRSRLLKQPPFLAREATPPAAG